MITILDLIKTLYPWVNPCDTEFETAQEYDAAIAANDLKIQSIIDIYSQLFDPVKYGDSYNYVVGLMVAHVLYINDEKCLRISTAIKQLESGKNLSLDDVFIKSCGCNEGFLGSSQYGKELLAMKEQHRGFSAFVIGCY